jgi:putative peptidoglycan lipid II flippase
VGLGRDLALAYFFGTTGVADAFRVSLAAALVPTHFFMGDVLDSAFVPLYVRYGRTSPGSAARLLGLTGVYLLSLSLVLAAVIWFGGAWFIRFVAPGLAAETLPIAVRMVRWMGLGVPFYTLAALFSLYGLCTNRLRPLALRPVFQNAGLTLVIPLAAWIADPQWVGLGFSVAVALYLGYVVWELRPFAGLRAAWGTQSEGGELAVLFRTTSPLVFMMLLGQMLSVVGRAAASFVGVGAIASLDYARVLVETPHVLIGTAIATTVLSRFSVLELEALTDRVPRLIFSLLTWAMGIMLVLIAVAPDLVVIIYRRGRFDAAAAESVTLGVRGLALGGAFMTASYVMNRILSAQLRNRESIVPMALCVLVAILLNLVLAPRFGILGVGLAMSAAYLVLCGALAVRLRIGRALLARIPSWTMGAAVALGFGWALRPMLGSLVLRFGLISAVAAVGWLGASVLFSSTRADLRFLFDHVIMGWPFSNDERGQTHAG